MFRDVICMVYEIARARMRECVCVHFPRPFTNVSANKPIHVPIRILYTHLVPFFALIYDGDEILLLLFFFCCHFFNAMALS